MQESFESLLLMEFPIPKPNVISRLEPEEELGVPDPNDSKEWEILRVAPPDDGTGSEEDEEEESPEPLGSETAALAVLPCRGAEEIVTHLPLSGASRRSRRPSPQPWDPRHLAQEHPARRRRWRRCRRRGGDEEGEEAPNACGQCRRGGSFSRRSEPPGKEKPYKCLDCGKSFTRSSNRNAHQRLHAGARPFVFFDADDDAGDADAAGAHQNFPRSSDLAGSPAGRRPYPCAQCGMSCGWRSEEAMAAAAARRHGGGGGGHAEGGVGGGGERPPRCGKGFEGGSNPKPGQRRLQPGQRPYACGDCGKSFSYSSAFLKHRRSHGGGGGGGEGGVGDGGAGGGPRRGHGGESPHRCPQCGKGFKQSAGLLRHQRVHLG